MPRWWIPIQTPLVAVVALTVCVGLLAAPAGVVVNQSPSVDSFIPVRLAATFGGRLGGALEEVEAAVVTPAFFPSGVSPVVGRFLQAADGASDDFVPVVISNGLYHSRMGGNLDEISTPILIEGQRLSVVGVAPQSFGTPEAGWLWLPRVGGDQDDPRVLAAAAIDGEWSVELEREGPVLWPLDEPERQLSPNVRGRLTLAAVRVPTCQGCTVLKGTLRVPLTSMLPAATPAKLRLLPERPAGDESRAVTGLVAQGNRIQLRTTSGDCQRCGEISITLSPVGQNFVGDWTLETAAMTRAGDRGTVTLRRIRGPGHPAPPS